MIDDVDAEAERAANAARAAVKRANRSSGILMPVLLVILAVLSLAALLMADRNAAQPSFQPRAEGPSTTQPAN
jgi:hypothetical protein